MNTRLEQVSSDVIAASAMGDTYHRVEGTPSLLLQLGGEKSKFVDGVYNE